MNCRPFMRASWQSAPTIVKHSCAHFCAQPTLAPCRPLSKQFRNVPFSPIQKCPLLGSDLAAKSRLVDVLLPMRGWTGDPGGWSSAVSGLGSVVGGASDARSRRVKGGRDAGRGRSRMGAVLLGDGVGTGTARRRRGRRAAPGSGPAATSRSAGRRGCAGCSRPVAPTPVLWVRCSRVSGTQSSIPGGPSLTDRSVSNCSGHWCNRVRTVGRARRTT